MQKLLLQGYDVSVRAMSSAFWTCRVAGCFTFALNASSAEAEIKSAQVSVEVTNVAQLRYYAAQNPDSVYVIRLVGDVRWADPATMPFKPTPANWKNLTIGATSAIIGSAAATNLRGAMTGIGLVFVTVGIGGTFNFDNVLITVTGVGRINVGRLTGGTLNLSWVGNPAVNLQSNTNLSTSNWVDIPGTLGRYSFPVPVSGPQKFFRLKGP